VRYAPRRQLPIGEEKIVSAAQNIETVKAMYEAFGRGDINAIIENCRTTSTGLPTR
jgi:hypothetical protein